MQETYMGRHIIGKALPRDDGRWTVAAEIDGAIFRAEDGIGYILETEAEKEGLNIARRLIDMGRA